MRKISSMILVAASLILVAPTSSSAHDSASTCAGHVDTVATPAGTFYVDDRRPDHGDFKNVPTSGYWSGIVGTAPLNHSGNGVWLYQESNGRAGLQRGGYNAILMALVEDEELVKDLGGAETCNQTTTPDTIIF